MSAGFILLRKLMKIQVQIPKTHQPCLRPKKLIYTPNSNKADFISHSPIISIHPIQTWKIKDIMQKGFFCLLSVCFFHPLASSTLRHSFSSYSSSSSSLDALCCFSVLQFSFESDLGFWLQHEFVFVCLEMIRIIFLRRLVWWGACIIRMNFMKLTSLPYNSWPEI